MTTLEELPSFTERQFPDVGDVGHHGTVVGELALYDVLPEPLA